MKTYVALALVATCVGMTYGWGQRYQAVKVSQANYVSIAVALVTKRYDGLMKEAEALKPATKTCSDKVTAQNNTCMNCISGLTQCGDLSILETALMAIKNPEMLRTLSKKLLVALGDQIAGGVGKLYSKYGAGPVKTLKKGWNGMANGVNKMGNWMKSTFGGAFNKMINGFAKFGKNTWSWAKSGWNTFKGMFGRRRRSDGSYEVDDDLDDETIEELREYLYPSAGSRARRADQELTPAQKKCIKNQCSACDPFIDATDAGADPVDAWRKICGASIINKNLAINKKAESAKKFYAVMTGDVTDIIKTIEVDTQLQGLITKLVAWTGKMFKQYGNPKNIKFDPWNQDPAYKLIAEYILSTF